MIEHIADLNLAGDSSTGKKLTQLFDGLGRRIVSVELAGGDLLSKHKTGEPISVLCLAGNGVFRAGEDLDEVQTLSPGTLITLEADIPHSVNAKTSMRLLVTKFKPYGEEEQ